MTFTEFKQKMSAIVGDVNTVARYLVEKQGHTALLGWAFGCIALAVVLPAAMHFAVGLTMLVTALLAAAVYDGTGKVIWTHQHEVPSWAAEIRDTLFDFWDGAFVATWPFVLFAWWALPVALVVWGVVFWVLDSAAWGSPS